MRVEYDFIARGYIANLLRIRASRQRRLAAERSKTSRTDELLSEAAFCEAQAEALDDAIESAVANDKEPSRVTASRDIDAVAEPPRTE